MKIMNRRKRLLVAERARAVVKMEDDILFWQTQIKLTQAPEAFKPQIIPESAIPFYQKPENIRSFLFDPFGKKPSGTYGLELTANDNIEVVFFTKFESESEAIKIIVLIFGFSRGISIKSIVKRVSTPFCL